MGSGGGGITPLQPFLEIRHVNICSRSNKRAAAAVFATSGLFWPQSLLNPFGGVANLFQALSRGALGAPSGSPAGPTGVRISRYATRRDAMK
jgi:hypothetical protein